MNTTETQPDPAQQHDPVRTLIRLSAVLTTIMALLAGVLIWRAQSDRPAANASADAHTEPPADGSVDYTFTVNGSEQQPLTPPEPVKVADFELIERTGRKVSNRDLLGKPWVASFIFINCAGPCRRVTGQMKLLQDQFAGTPVQLVTITVDPKRDTPQALSNYADNFGAEREWLFLTKDQETIYPLIRDSFGQTVQEETGPNRREGWEITHTTIVAHVDAKGRVRGKYNALDQVEMAALVRELRKEIAALPEEFETPGAADADEPPVLAPLPMSEGAARG